MPLPEPLVAVWDRVRILPRPYKLALAGAVFACLALSWIAVGAGTHWIERSRFERAEAQRAEERKKLEADRDAWIKTAVEAEGRAAAYEEQAKAAKAKLPEADRKIETADQNAERIADETKAEIDAVDDRPVSPDERRERIRAKLRDLGYLP